MKTKSKDFRRVPKVRFGLEVPPALAKRVRRVAFDRQVSLTQAATEAFARWVGDVPASFGVEPADSPK